MPDSVWPRLWTRSRAGFTRCLGAAGQVCGVRVEDIEEPTMREIRYLDKLVDELAKGKALEKILRKE